MSEKQLRRLPLAAAALFACVSAQADYQSPDGNFRMSGFGTVGAARSTTDDALFNYPGQGGGANNQFSLNPDTKMAVQGSYKFSNTVSGTAQMLAKYNARGVYQPGFEWAFAKWQATPGLAVRAGRMGAPFFMVSDFRDVGYANTTVRPALDVYGQVPVSQFEGVDASYQFNLGSATITSTLWTGNSEAPFSSSLTREPSEVILKRQVGVNLVTELSNGLSLRLGRSQGKMTIKSQLSEQLTAGANSAILRGGLAGYGASAAPDAAAAVAANAQLNQGVDLLNPTGVDASFTGVGLAYDQDNWVGSLEYTQRKTDSYVPDTKGWYTVLGYRVGTFTPYLGLSKLKVTRASSNPVAPVNLVGSSALTGGVNTVYGGINVLLGTQKLSQRTATVGVRWDARSNVAIKAQFDRVSKPADSNGLFLVADPTTAQSRAYTAGKKNISIVTLSVDFVF